MVTLQGLLLFAFIPLVLFLYLSQPLGPVISIVVGVVLMVGHRFLAAPWMARHATHRCLWCAGAAATDQQFVVTSEKRAWTVAACGPAHRALAGRFLSFLETARHLVFVGIFIPLLILIVGTLLVAGGLKAFSPEAVTLQFKTTVAFTVLAVSLAYFSVRRPAESIRCPLPLYNFFLLGIRNTLWVFRIVGAWWLVSGILALLAQ